MPLEINRMPGNHCNCAWYWFLLMRKDGELYLDPPFQRGSVWTEAQQVAWIESILDDLPRPAIFVNQGQMLTERGAYDDKTVVVDGRQRLEAVFRFVDDQLAVRGQRWSEQTEAFQRGFKMLTVPVIISSFTTERECVELYVKLLTCGTAHTEDEIRKAKEMLKEKP